MKLVEYTYTVVQYVHDPGAGETMNIGVLLFAPEKHFLRAEFCHTYERLSKAFVDFDGDHFKRAVRRFESGHLTSGGALGRPDCSPKQMRPLMSASSPKRSGRTMR